MRKIARGWLGRWARVADLEVRDERLADAEELLRVAGRAHPLALHALVVPGLEEPVVADELAPGTQLCWRRSTLLTALMRHF